MMTHGQGIRGIIFADRTSAKQAKSSSECFSGKTTTNARDDRLETGAPPRQAHLLLTEDKVVELLLQNLVGVVDQELLVEVLGEHLEPKNVQQADKPEGGRIRRQHVKFFFL